MFDLKLGDDKIQVKITDFQQKTVQLVENNKPSEKIVLITETEEGRQYNIDEVWVKGKAKPTGLWITLDSKGSISASSTLGRFLKFMQVSSLKELCGKQITLTPKDNNFMAAVAYNE
jgi:hypothetical protein